MKLKIAVLTSSVLTVILLILSSFLYLSVYNRVLALEYSKLSNGAQGIVQYYGNHLPGRKSHDATELRKLLSQYNLTNEEVLVIGLNHDVITAVGTRQVDDVMAYFQPVTQLVQRSLIFDQNDQVIYTAAPIQDASSLKTVAYLVLISDRSFVQDYMESLLTVLVIGSAGAVLLAGIGGYGIASTTLRPIRELSRVVERIQATRLDERVPTTGRRDEVARLTRTFNNMLNRIERSFEQQSQFVADASHEIRTPLTTIIGYANLLARWGTKDPAVLEQAITVIQKESLRLRDLADGLLILASLEASRQMDSSDDADVDGLVREVVEEMTTLDTEHLIHQSYQAGKCARVTPQHLRQIVTNVLGNALKYTPAGGTVRIATKEQRDTVMIEISDTGSGIPKEDLPHVLKRFYRADKSRERKQGGNGLGLAIVSELVHLSEGTIEITSTVGQGTCVTIGLPVASDIPDASLL